MKKIKFIIILLILSLGIGGGYYFYNVFFEKNTVFDDDYIYLKIPTNSSKDQIIDSLSIYLEDTSKFIKACNYNSISIVMEVM